MDSRFDDIGHCRATGLKDDPDIIERSGGLFLDMTIHDFDMARYLIGDEVTETYAAAGVRFSPTPYGSGEGKPWS